MWRGLHPKVSEETFPRALSSHLQTTCASWFLWHPGQLSSLKRRALAPLPLSPVLLAAIQNQVPYHLSSLTIPGPLGTRRACNPAAGQAPSQATQLSYTQVSCLWFALLKLCWFSRPVLPPGLVWRVSSRMLWVTGQVGSHVLSPVSRWEKKLEPRALVTTPPSWLGPPSWSYVPHPENEPLPVHYLLLLNGVPVCTGWAGQEMTVEPMERQNCFEQVPQEYTFILWAKMIIHVLQSGGVFLGTVCTQIKPSAIA